MRAVLVVVLLSVCGTLQLCTSAAVHNTARIESPEEIVAKPVAPHTTGERITPDYKEGPWFEMGEGFPFEAHTSRPRLQEAMKLLRQVSQTIVEARAEAVNTRNAKKPQEERMIDEGNSMVTRLTTEIEAIKHKTAAHNAIVPLQASITQVISNDLVPALRLASRLHQIDADVRLPFAERLAVYTQDLQKVLRAREDAQCSMQEYLTATELTDALRQYDAIASEIQDKVSNEVSTASEVLTPNDARLQDTLAKIAAAEDKLGLLRKDLENAISDGKGFIPDEQGVKETTLTNEEALVRSVEAAGKAQDVVVTHVQEIENEQLTLAHHIASVLSGMMAEEEDLEDATQLPRAQQKVVGLSDEQ